MKKLTVVFVSLALASIVVGCSEKRCACTTIRGNNEYVSHSLEPLEGRGSCSELDAEWVSTIDNATMLKKECVPEE